MGLPTASVLFMNPEGGCMFKVFLRRNAERALDVDQMASYQELAARFS
jgi:putative heme iron utilization protein